MANSKLEQRGPQKLTAFRIVLLILCVLALAAVMVFIFTMQFGTVNAKYEVSFELNGGQTVDGATYIDDLTLREFTEEDIPEVIKDGITFEGWFLDAAFTEELSLPMKLKSDITIYAKWSYNVSFYANSPEVGLAPQNIMAVEAFSAPTVSYPGFELAGWYTTPDFTGLEVSFPCVLTSDYVRLYAKWVPVGNTESYNVTVSLGDVFLSFPAKVGTLLNLPALSSFDGKTFVGYGVMEQLIADFNKTSITPDNSSSDIRGTDFTLYTDYNDFSYTVLSEKTSYTMTAKDINLVAIWSMEGTDNYDDLVEKGLIPEPSVDSNIENFRQLLKTTPWCNYSFTTLLDAGYINGNVWATVSKTVFLINPGALDAKKIFAGEPDKYIQNPQTEEDKLHNLGVNKGYFSFNHYSCVDGTAESEYDFRIQQYTTKDELLNVFYTTDFSDRDMGGLFTSNVSSSYSAAFEISVSTFTSVLGGNQSFVVKFDENGGSEVKDIVGNHFSSLPTPVREGYKFEGWYSSNDFSYISSVYKDPVKLDPTREFILQADAIIYARWEAIEVNGKDPSQYEVIVMNGTENNIARFKVLAGAKLTEDDILGAGIGNTMPGYKYVIQEVPVTLTTDIGIAMYVSGTTVKSFPVTVSEDTMYTVMWYREGEDTIATLIKRGQIDADWGGGTTWEKYGPGTAWKFLSVTSEGCDWVGNFSSYNVNDMFTVQKYKWIEVINYVAQVNHSNNIDLDYFTTFATTYVFYEKSDVSTDFLNAVGPVSLDTPTFLLDFSDAWTYGGIYFSKQGEPHVFNAFAYPATNFDDGFVLVKNSKYIFSTAQLQSVLGLSTPNLSTYGVFTTTKAYSKDQSYTESTYVKLYALTSGTDYVNVFAKNFIDLPDAVKSSNTFMGWCTEISGTPGNKVNDFFAIYDPYNGKPVAYIELYAWFYSIGIL